MGDRPLIGPAFRDRSDLRVRTELIVFLRPKMIRGTAEADRIADDFRQPFEAMMPVPAAHAGCAGAGPSRVGPGGPGRAGPVGTPWPEA